MTLREQYGEDTRFIFQLPKREQYRLMAHIRYTIKREMGYLDSVIYHEAMDDRICNMFR